MGECPLAQRGSPLPCSGVLQADLITHHREGLFTPGEVGFPKVLGYMSAKSLLHPNNFSCYRAYS